ncbi:tetratricopeptide repeat protein [Actinoplanes sp. NPDC020271]|uniref:tetratricopeptide repeat protein n=1 Tax=Actinoplanes sp. NPDC020271 TaxID=3363896 RepID=UPI0037B1DFD2
MAGLTRRRALVVAAVVALLIGAFFWFGDRLGFWAAPSGGRAGGSTGTGLSDVLDSADKISSIASFLLAVGLAVTARRSPAATGHGAGAGSGMVTRTLVDLVDRKKESRRLRTALRSRRSRIILVSGDPGVGKSELVSRVLQDLKIDPLWTTVTALNHPGVRAVIAAVRGAGDPGSASAPGGDNSWQGELELALRALGTTPLVIVFDAAEHLLLRDGQLHDLALDEAFQLLVSGPAHRLKIVFVTQREPVAYDGDWVQTATRIAVTGLPPRYFRQFAQERSVGRSRSLASLGDARMNDLWPDLDGRPRLVQLFDAVLDNDDHTDAGDLAAEVHGWAGSQRDVTAVYEHLLNKVITTLSDDRRDIYRAVAALNTPATAALITQLVNRRRDKHHQLSVGRVRTELESLSGHVIYRLGTEPSARYGLPALEAHRALSLNAETQDEDQALLLEAGQLLREQRRAGHRSASDDPQSAVAEVDALIRGGFVVRAYRSITELDTAAQTGSPSAVFWRFREQIAPLLTGADRREDNYLALGYLYFANGDFAAARTAYREVLARESGLGPVEAKAYLNLAWVSWEQGLIESARSDFERALRLEPQDPAVVAGALEGIGRCCRRHGLFEEALSMMVKAREAAEPYSPQALRIMVRILRLHLDLGRIRQAELVLDRIEEIADHHPNRNLHAIHLDACADFYLVQGHLDQALSTAQDAAELALRGHDPVTAFHAQTTICMVRLRQQKWSQAAREAARAERHAGAGRGAPGSGLTERSLLGTALRAVACHRAGRPDEAHHAARYLLEQSTLRGTNDIRDFATWEFAAIAQCVLHLQGQAGIELAIDALQKANHHSRQPATEVTNRTVFLLKTLDAGEHRLRPALDALTPPGNATPAGLPVHDQNADG